MAAGITTSIRMPEEVRDRYETIARATGRARNDLMVEVLRQEGQRRIDAIALILEGREQARSGQLSPLEDVVARLKERGMLPAGFELNAADVTDAHDRVEIWRVVHATRQRPPVEPAWAA